MKPAFATAAAITAVLLLAGCSTPATAPTPTPTAARRVVRAKAPALTMTGLNALSDAAFQPQANGSEMTTPVEVVVTNHSKSPMLILTDISFPKADAGSQLAPDQLVHAVAADTQADATAAAAAGGGTVWGELSDYSADGNGSGVFDDLSLAPHSTEKLWIAESIGSFYGEEGTGAGQTEAISVEIDGYVAGMGDPRVAGGFGEPHIPLLGSATEKFVLAMPTTLTAPTGGD
jgi:hypothetical protein